ncbi:MAG: NBR1-Ig-like domain-containing protein [Anaerolineae bacterium]|nr:NBR1-Ig-like domain-containing protein [Anaerolineae bacterium]
MINKQFRPIIPLTLLILILSGCTLPTSANSGTTTDPSAIQTSAAMTVEAQIASQAAPSVQATFTSTVVIPTALPTATLPPSQPTNTPLPTNTVVTKPCDLAGFVRDVTINDGTKFTPGETFRKKWELINNGTCTWTSGYELVFDSGDAMGGPAAKQMTSSNVAPGEKVEVFVDLTAPAVVGKYKGNWKLRNPDNEEFGLSGNKPFWVEIEVISATATADASIHKEKESVLLKQTFMVNLDTAKVSPSSGEDLFFHAASADNKYIDAQNGAKFLVWGFGKPSHDDCKNAAVSGDDIKIDSTLINKYICYLTDAGRPGYMFIKDLTPADKTQAQTLEFYMITWVAP